MLPEERKDDEAAFVVAVAALDKRVAGSLVLDQLASVLQVPR